MLPGLWLQHMGQVAAVIQARQHTVALPPAWHECDRAASAQGRQCSESEQQSRAGTFAQDRADSSASPCNQLGSAVSGSHWMRLVKEPE